jgi:hypothetical protein
MYGGDAFDNMEDFSQAMAMILLIKKFEPKEITFANIWGVCDEDM